MKLLLTAIMATVFTRLNIVFCKEKARTDWRLAIKLSMSLHTERSISIPTSLRRLNRPTAPKLLELAKSSRIVCRLRNSFICFFRKEFIVSWSCASLKIERPTFAQGHRGILNSVGYDFQFSHRIG